MINQQENLITRINYSVRAKGLFGIAIFSVPALLLRSLERGPNRNSLPIFMQGHLFDSFATPVFAFGGKVFVDDNLIANLSSGLAINVAFEFAQKYHLAEGVYDLNDIGAYTIGALGFAAFEGTAKLIHDSGLSLPIYRLLGIQHRKFG
ncbi:hypothetical protein A2767_03130 [Candidatus Roizmanbacteria bacterium RIFCSPHIGHO2_01_FULL_35_10]|uniref:Uncharacterized protein n=1 Tax=Candidatus Roizmanbacteria bacterium RIFCSPLOWO2_01_FULL_35_13 TaxID=1802055 RepID=A0A1F7IFF5_9BACT|nr:MAG: hypothetical protein A2767_03130 [Candidatus Roizmanbacteria bacterium RIFCSPHIGHO2_01_FULL_35_10]OGK42084.1 MAG: hypothetical protein A3A74_04920 [Candidatus Roizmanbacteria bacterium RIFCSPLOWO2_01_FULL_35_13]